MPLATMTLLSATQEPGAGFIILAAHAAPEKLTATPATAANTAIFESDLFACAFPLRLRTFMLHRRRNRARRSDVAGEAYVPSRQMPSASCAGRSEIENSTACFAAICE